MAKLTDRMVSEITRVGRFSDGHGLCLRVTACGSKFWFLRYYFGGVCHEISLGPVGEVTLDDGRAKRREAADLRDRGINPRNALCLRKRLGPVPTFGDVAADLIGRLEPGWKNPKHRQQWRNTLQAYAAPIWKRPVDSIDIGDMLAIRTPIWTCKTETADRVRGRIERVLDAATVRGLRAGENPARWKGRLSILLPPRNAVQCVRHHPSLAFEEMPSFMVKLRRLSSTSARALEFTILTAARSGETLMATWAEIDLEAAVWTIPATRMKGGRDHRVPLSADAIDVLVRQRQPRSLNRVHLFPGQKRGRPISGMSMAMALRRMDFSDVTVHGFRSTFRDWAGECTWFARELMEAALAHSIGNQVERAYRRRDALEKRRPLMEEWAAFLRRAP